MGVGETKRVMRGEHLKTKLPLLVWSRPKFIREPESRGCFWPDGRGIIFPWALSDGGAVARPCKNKRDRAAGLGRNPVLRSPRSVHRPGSASRSSGPALTAAASQAPRDWDHRTRPSSRSRWRKLPERREGASACCFPPVGRAGRRGGARAPEAIVGVRREHPSRGALRRWQGSPRSPVHPELRVFPGVDLWSHGWTACSAVPRGAAGPPGLRR